MVTHHLVLVLEFILLSIALFGGGYVAAKWPNYIWGAGVCVFVVWLLVILEMIGQI